MKAQPRRRRQVDDDNDGGQGSETTKAKHLSDRELQYVDWTEVLKHMKGQFETLATMAHQHVNDFTERLRKLFIEYDNATPAMKRAYARQIKRFENGLRHFQKQYENISSMVADMEVNVADTEMADEAKRITDLGSVYMKRGEEDSRRKEQAHKKMESVMDMLQVKYEDVRTHFDWLHSAPRYDDMPVEDVELPDLTSLRAELGIVTGSQLNQSQLPAYDDEPRQKSVLALLDSAGPIPTTAPESRGGGGSSLASSQITKLQPPPVQVSRRNGTRRIIVRHETNDS